MVSARFAIIREFNAGTANIRAYLTKSMYEEKTIFTSFAAQVVVSKLTFFTVDSTVVADARSEKNIRAEIATISNTIRTPISRNIIPVITFLSKSPNFIPTIKVIAIRVLHALKGITA